MAALVREPMETGPSMTFIPAAAAEWPRPEILGRISRKIDHVLSIPSEIALRMANPPLSPDGAGAEDEAGATEAALARLPALDARIAADLHRTGVAVTNLHELALPGTGTMLRAAHDMQVVLESRCLRADIARKHTVSARPADILARDALLRWALNARLLDIVEAYFGGPAAYDGLLFYRSHPDGREEGVREWHRDREDARMLKVAIYLTDVDENGGPFEMISPEFQALVDQREGWKYPVMDTARLNSGIPEEIRAGGVRTITGARGTVMFADAARFHHRGKPPTTHHRDAIFHSFFGRSPRHPYCCERSMMSRAQIATFAGTLDARGREAMLWRDALPLRKRLIPPNRIKI